jgi:ribosome-associated protein
VGLRGVGGTGTNSPRALRAKGDSHAALPEYPGSSATRRFRRLAIARTRPRSGSAETHWTPVPPTADESLPVTATDRSIELINAAAQAAADRLAHDITAYDVSDVLSITDAFLLASAPNDRQVKAIVEEIEEQLNKKLGAKPVRREGDRDARWILLDYVDIVIHVQHSEERVYYALERLWKDCPELPLPEDAVKTRGKAAEHAKLRGAEDHADLDGELS